MKKLLSIFFIGLITITIAGCAKEDNAEGLLQLENESLKKRIVELEAQVKDFESLRVELEKYKYNEVSLLYDIQEQYGVKEYNKALDIIHCLLTKHPDTIEAQKAKELLKSIKEVQKANKAKKPVMTDTKEYIAASKAKKERTFEGSSLVCYQDINSPSREDINAYYVYFSFMDEGIPLLKLRIQYAGEELLNIQKFTLNVDGASYEITPSSDSVVGKTTGTLSWEVYDTAVDSSIYELLDKVGAAQKVTITYVGEAKSIERTLSSQEKKSLANALLLYKSAGALFE